MTASGHLVMSSEPNTHLSNHPLFNTSKAETTLSFISSDESVYDVFAVESFRYEPRGHVDVASTSSDSSDDCYDDINIIEEHHDSPERDVDMNVAW